MHKKQHLLFVAVMAAFILIGLCHAEVWAGVGSCQVRTEGKLDCMEFSGNLPPYTKSVCTTDGSQNTKWVESACPRDNVLGVCDVPRTDGVKQLIYCYRMAQLPDKQRLEFCRMGCKGAFSTTSGGLSGTTGSTVSASPQTPKPSGTTAPATVGNSRATATASTGASQYAMEQNTNRAGDDYKNLDLNAPNPALCAQACANESKCKAWTYVKPGVQADNAKCWLKDRVPPRSPDENCVSGLKKASTSGGDTVTTGTTTGSQNYRMETNINLPGEDYKDLDLQTADPRLCAQACMKEAKCKAWTYVKPGVQADNAKCWLKDKVPPPTYDENCVSGDRTRRD